MLTLSATSYDPRLLNLAVFWCLLKSLIIPLQTKNGIHVCDILVTTFEAWSKLTKADVNTGSLRGSGIHGRSSSAISP